jgi:ankyrin repeat protein
MLANTTSGQTVLHVLKVRENFMGDRNESLEELLKLLLHYGIDVNSRDAGGKSVLLAMASTCRLTSGIIKLLHSAMADMLATTAQGQTALHVLQVREKSIFSRNPEESLEDMMSSLLRYGIDVNVRDTAGNSVLLAMASSGSLTPGVIEVLHRAGADMLATNTSGHTALHVCLDTMTHEQNRNKDSKAVVSALVQHGADINDSDKDGNSTLLDLAANSILTPDIIEMLHRAGADMSATDHTGHTAAHVLDCRYYDHSEYSCVLQSLLEHGLNPNVYDTTGNPVLLDMARKGVLTVDIISALHTAGADMSATNTCGQTAVHALCEQWNRYTDTNTLVASLVQHGVDVNIRDMYGNTVLMTLAQCGKLTGSVVEILHRAGSDMSATNTAGQTVVHLMNKRCYCYSEYKSVMSYLFRSGVWDAGVIQ